MQTVLLDALPSRKRECCRRWHVIFCTDMKWHIIWYMVVKASIPRLTEHIPRCRSLRMPLTGIKISSRCITWSQNSSTHTDAFTPTHRSGCLRILEFILRRFSTAEIPLYCARKTRLRLVGYLFIPGETSEKLETSASLIFMSLLFLMFHCRFLQDSVLVSWFFKAPEHQLELTEISDFC